MDDLTGTASIFTILIATIVVVSWFRLATLEKRVAAISGLHGKLDALLKHAGIEFNPYENLAEDVVRAIQRGEKIQAIKHYRAATGVGLKEAKEFIEEVQRRAGVSFRWPHS